jgi:hypothetical protein
MQNLDGNWFIISCWLNGLGWNFRLWFFNWLIFGWNVRFYRLDLYFWSNIVIDLLWGREDLFAIDWNICNGNINGWVLRLRRLRGNKY